MRSPKARLLASTLLCAALAFADAGRARADTTVNFDTLSTGPAANQAANVGLVFSQGFLIKNDTNSGHVLVPSAPNYLDLDHDLSGGMGVADFCSPLDPNIPAVVPYVTISNHGLNNFDGLGWFNGIQFSALDLTGNTLDTMTIPPTSKPNGRPISTIQLNGPGIHELRLTLVDSPNGSNALAPTDDWTFGSLTTAPEPSAGLLTATAIILMSSARRKARA